MQQAFSFPNDPAHSKDASKARANVVIEAGAGTGKTTAIVAEVLKLMVERDDLAPERVVLMTFTEKAAGEIAERIRRALEELASSGSRTWPIGSSNPLVTIDDPERARRAIAHHLAHIDALRSQTIHSFCQSLLRGFPIEAGLDPQFKIIEGFERSLLYGQVYDAWLDAETRVDARAEFVKEWELLFTHAGYLFQIRELILGLSERRDLLGETDYSLGEFGEVREPLLDALHAIRRCADDVGDEHARRVFAYVRENTPRVDALDDCIDYLQPLAASIREANLPRHGVLKEALRILRAGDKGRCIYDRLVSHRAALALVSLTRRFVAYLDEEKRKVGVVDFDDLLLRTQALLEDATVLERARGQFDYIFVDEFQDTDRTQARIIDRLARDASGRFVPGKTIVVGDPKQSIYGFRRADPETYYRMTEELKRGGADPRVITDQYRSDPALLDAINAMFAKLFPAEAHDPNVFRPAYHALTARAKPRRDLDARITLLHAQHDEKSDRYFAEAEAAASFILANREGGERDLQRFAILFRRLTKLDDYVDTLERYGIPYVLPPTRMFLDRRAPVDLLAVLRAIAYPFDKGAQISAARTPYFALTDVEIVEGRVAFPDRHGAHDALSPDPDVIPRFSAESPADGASDALSEGDPAPRRGMTRPEHAWTDFTRTISRFRDLSQHLTVSQLLDLVITTTGIERVYEQSIDGTRHLGHLEHVRAIAFEYDQRHGGSVRQFVDEIARRRDEPEEMEPSLVDDSSNAVRILSVHAAKGLEFDTVILPDLAFPTSTSDALQLFTVEEPRSLVLAGRAESISSNFRFAGEDKLKKLAGKRDEAELRRLFYVAVTRARTDVVFVCNVHEETKNIGFLKCLTEALEIDRKELAKLWPESGREVRATPIGPVAFERPEAASQPAARAAKRLRDAALETELAHGEIVPAVMPEVAAVATPLATSTVAALRAASRSRAAGTLLHRVLELWDGRGDVEPLLRQLAIEAAADADAVSRVRRRLGVISRSNVLQRIASAETVGREFPVRFIEDGVVVERRIDRIVREAEADLVVDYKSGHADEERMNRDREQVARYCRALEAITGRDCRGAVWYVGLDGERVVEVE